MKVLNYSYFKVNNLNLKLYFIHTLLGLLFLKVFVLFQEVSKTFFIPVNFKVFKSNKKKKIKKKIPVVLKSSIKRIKKKIPVVITYRSHSHQTMEMLYVVG